MICFGNCSRCTAHPPHCKSLTWRGAGISWRLHKGGAPLRRHGQGHLLLFVLCQRCLDRFRVDICETGGHTLSFARAEEAENHTRLTRVHPLLPAHAIPPFTVPEHTTAFHHLRVTFPLQKRETEVSDVSKLAARPAVLVWNPLD